MILDASWCEYTRYHSVLLNVAVKKQSGTESIRIIINLLPNFISKH